MTDATVQVPPLAELRSGLSYSGLAKADPEMHAAFAALLDIAEAAQAVAHEAEFYADDDTPDGSLIVVPRADMKKLDEALAKVRP